jgi:hypothetical protein
MKKSVLPLALLLLGVTLSGCPVYDSANSGCYRDVDCPYGDLCNSVTGSCYSAPTNTSITCSEPTDCAKNETCSRSGICMVGDCHFASVGCVSGRDCVIDDHDRWRCLKTGEGTGTGGAAAGSAGESDAGSPASSAGAPNISTGGAPEPASAAGAGG